MRFPHSLHWRIAIAYTALIFLTMGAVSIYLVGFIRATFTSDLEERLRQEALLLSEAAAPYFDPLDQPGLQQISERTGAITGARVTIIDRAGRVLADNVEAPSAMEGHSARPEFVVAMSSGIGRSTRYSAALGTELLHVAVPIQANGGTVGVARVAVPTSLVQNNMDRIISTIGLAALVVGAMSIGLGYWLAHRTSRSVYSVAEGARRLAEGDLEHRVKALASDETQELADAFNRMAATIRNTVEDLSGERNMLSAVLDTMADGIIVVEPDGCVSLINRAAEWLLNARVKNPMDSRFAEIVRDHELQELVSRTMSSRRPQQTEVELLHRRRFLSAIATPLRRIHAPEPSHGRASSEGGGVLLTLHDLTRIRQVETTRKEFVTNVSHELRSPLASVKAMVETLADGAMDDAAVARDFLQRIRRDIDRMNRMVNDLLELARLESGYTSLHLAPMDLHPVVEDVVTRYREQARAKGIKLECDIPPDLPLVIGEEAKLHQVLVNLMDNALKFTLGPGKVTVAARANGRFVEVSVRDTGSGIPAEHLPHVFERFYKVDRARRDGGTGLGLAIVKHIVQAHGGDVSALSTEGAGSTFSFTVPRAT